jgi:hypothetical protein
MDKIRIVMGECADRGDVCEQGNDGKFYPVSYPSKICCAFCGYDNCVISSRNLDIAPFHVVCPSCGAKGPRADSSNKAVSLWNVAGDK